MADFRRGGWGQSVPLPALIGNKQFVVDVSRDGDGRCD
ncbi:hypothetical protein ABIB54_001915 [Frigoribacterium sp. UYMn621]